VRVHELKSWPALFEALSAGSKTHELRRNDRDYKVGDVLLLREYNPDAGQYTSRQIRVVVTYITSTTTPCAASGEALDERFCILSVKLA